MSTVKPMPNNYEKPDWFIMPGSNTGRVTLERQLAGLEVLLAEAHGMSVLDLGCAEGLIGEQFIKRGAKIVRGVEWHLKRVDFANNLFKRYGPPTKVHKRKFSAVLGNLERLDSVMQNHGFMNHDYDIVLALAICHKLTYPDVFLEEAAARATKYMAVRTTGAIINTGPDLAMFSVPALMSEVGFVPLYEGKGHPGTDDDTAWLGLYVRHEHSNYIERDELSEVLESSVMADNGRPDD